MIPSNKCTHRGLYRIHSRNLTLAIYDSQDHGFTGIREKFGNTYLDTEIHHEHKGTVHPHALITTLPNNIDNHETTYDPTTDTYIENKPLYNWLQEQQTKHPKEEI